MLDLKKLDTSAKDEDLRLNRTEIKFINKVRQGTKDLFFLTDNDLEKYNEFTFSGFIKHGFALFNPQLFQNNVNLFFLLFKGDPKENAYCRIKKWIMNNIENYNYSAYTTVGEYDFILRLVATKEMIADIKSQLGIYGVTGEYKGDRGCDFLMLEITETLIYNKVTVFGDLHDIKESLLEADKRFLFSINEGINPNQPDKLKLRKLYRSLTKQNLILGTRCIVDSPRLHNMITFILVHSPYDYDIMSLLGKDLKDNIIDMFRFIGYSGYSHLIICEFDNVKSSPLSKYNRWMEKLYCRGKQPCLTFISDTTICDFPDTYESSGKLKNAIKKYYKDGIILGKGVWFNHICDDIIAKTDYSSLIRHGVIAGIPRFGKTNTCLYLSKELAGKDIKVLLINFKENSSIHHDDIKSVNGKEISGDDFLKIETLKDIEKGVNFVLTDAKKRGEEIALHCIKLASDLSTTGEQQPLSYVIILDEILNITNNLPDLVRDKLVPMLKTVGEKGIGIIITTHTIADWEQIWEFCFNKFFHRLLAKDAESSTVQTLGPILGLSSNKSYEFQNLKEGFVVCNPVGKTNIPPIVVKVDLIKKN